MKIINARIHGIIDYLVVIFLLLAPSIFMLSEPISTFTYVLAGIHLTLTILTNFKMGIIKVIPLKVHGAIELIVAIVLTASFLFVDSWAKSPADLYFLSGFGIAVFLTWMLTDYSN